ncbi:MAG TPA: c-type cytochrome biogenesis protein CcmI [Caulobacteraceae bacterium]|jgi:cytochrome c-type biogenesis protein CcmH|nr:c-type cytochrome biogenesis protein CcmI [Caulobacteraceae bacterium]
MIWLWIAAALVSAALAVLVVQRAARAARGPHGENPALAVYRRQMAELDELAERGVLAEGERRSVRAETGRRLLAAAGRAEAPLRNSGPRSVLLIAAGAPLAALAAYTLIGAPTFGDQPFGARLADWRNDAMQGRPLSAPQTAAVWRQLAQQHPTDPKPLVELARAEFASDEPTEAVQALHKAIALDPRRADLWELLAGALVGKNNGAIDPDASDAFRHVLALDPANAAARYYLARARIAGGDAAGGIADWRALEASLEPADPRRGLLAADIQTVTATGKLPAEAPAPSPAVGAPQIQQMVDGLAARLKANPDDPEGWVRLVRAYAVLGETDRLQAALGAARQRYAGKPDVLARLNAASAGPGQGGEGAPAPSGAMSPAAGTP